MLLKKVQKNKVKEKSRVDNEDLRPRSKTSIPELSQLPGTPVIIERKNHIVSRRNIDKDALKIIARLTSFGYRTFLVGGAVRDLLLGVKPKDYDLATEAKPEEVRRLFRNSRIIGRRFRLVHIFFNDGRIFETSTFRRDETTENVSASDGVEDTENAKNSESKLENKNADTKKKTKEYNTFGNPETDAFRRDITINGLFYDSNTWQIIDYVGGVADLEKKLVRMIGEPEQRFIEDPVRMLRVIRHAAKTSFKIDKQTYSAVCANVARIALCPPSRIFEEFLREMKHNNAAASFKLMIETKILEYLFPALFNAVVGDKKLHEKLDFTLKEMSALAANDLPQSVLFAALGIGILQGEVAPSPNNAGNIELNQVWCESPLKEYRNRADAKQINASKYLNQIRGGYLRSTVQNLFKVQGVSKREIEKMERILITRFLMFITYNESDATIQKNQISAVKSRNTFKEALHLLQLTARDAYAKKCLEFWKDIL